MKLIHNITNCDNPSNIGRCSCQNLRGDTIICRHLQIIWFHTQREDEANTSGLQSLSKKQSHLIWCWCTARRHINPILVYYLPILRAPDFGRFNERKWIFAPKARSRRYPARTITDADYTNDIPLPAITAGRAQSLWNSLEGTAGGIGLHVYADETEHMCFIQRGDNSSLNETCWQVHLSRKQRLIYRIWYQQATSECLDSYR